MPRSRQPSDTKTVSLARRRAAGAAAAAILLSGAPGIAEAAFSRTASGQVTASSLALTVPVSASVSAVCGNGRALAVSVANYGSVPGATAYEFILLNPSGVPVQTTAGSYSAHPAAKGTWTYQVRGIYTAGPGNVWTGTPYQGTVTC